MSVAKVLRKGVIFVQGEYEQLEAVFHWEIFLLVRPGNRPSPRQSWKTG